MRSTLAFVLVATALSAGPAFAQKACSKSEQDAAMKAIDRVSSWATLNATWKTYRHCDADQVADSFTDALLRLIIDWKNVETLASAMKDKDYEDFIISHLRSPAAQADTEDVISRAKHKCSSSLKSWCGELISAIDQAPLKPIPTAPAAPAAPSAPAPDKK